MLLYLYLMFLIRYFLEYFIDAYIRVCVYERKIHICNTYETSEAINIATSDFNWEKAQLQ